MLISMSFLPITSRLTPPVGFFHQAKFVVLWYVTNSQADNSISLLSLSGFSTCPIALLSLKDVDLACSQYRAIPPPVPVTTAGA